MKTYIVTSDLGERVWDADDVEHAREQHLDAFPDEPVLGTREATDLTPKVCFTIEAAVSDETAERVRRGLSVEQAVDILRDASPFIELVRAHA
jgi:hypothetical protein